MKRAVYEYSLLDDSLRNVWSVVMCAIGVLVDGDPSQDASALWNVADVFLNGNLVDRGNYV